MDIKALYFNPLRECCYVVWDETKECVIIDPGCFDDNEFSRLVKFVEENDLKPVKILLTHGHFDHVFGLEDTARKWPVAVLAHPEERFQLDYNYRWAPELGLKIKKYTGNLTPLSEGDVITFGNSSFVVIWTPGHTEGCVCFYSKENNVLFSGDTLFQGSIGRTDHLAGDYDKLIKSLDKLKCLPPQTDVFSGHGSPTTIGNEIATNPFMK